MFNITDETRVAAIDAMRDAITSCGEDAPSDETLNVAFDAAVAEVKRQFGM